MSQPKVLISGGGPVGLLCAWLLSRQGIAVRLFDVNDGPQRDPRAATTHCATLDLLDVDGLADDMARVGLVAPYFQFWDRPANRLVAQFDHGVLKDDTRHPVVVQCEQFKTASLILERVKKQPTAELFYGHEVIAVTQTEDAVTVTVRGPDGETQHTGDYLIGADGARSAVRKACGIPFNGFTWPERFLVLTTPHDFEKHQGYCVRSYFAEPGAWCNLFKVSADGPPGLWRAVFPTEPDASDEAIFSDEGVQKRIQHYLPWSAPYDIVHRNLYVTHQRVADTFRQGRVVLAGDSAHVNNPIGGMGLNGGIQDGVNLCEKLIGIIEADAPDTLLDLYSLQRRTVATEFVQEQSIENKKRLEQSDPDKRKESLDELSAIAADPARSRQFLLRASMIASQRRVAALELPSA